MRAEREVTDRAVERAGVDSSDPANIARVAAAHSAYRGTRFAVVQADCEDGGLAVTAAVLGRQQ